VVVDLKRVLLQDPRDRFWSNAEGPVGMLAIDLATRKRYRINGTMRRDGDQLVLEVDEAYPNCPKYISRRILDVPEAGSPVLGAGTEEFLSKTDVFFVASGHPQRSADVSHRGGPAGFVQVIDEKNLRIPDYPGNGMFNTLGNLAVDPHAGLLFPDFPGGRMLQMTGRAEIDWSGAERSWTFHIDQSVELALPEGLKSEWIDASPYNPR